MIIFYISNTSRGSEITPVTAAAAATATPDSIVRAPGPCRPSKLRFEVETLYLPAGILSAFIARHAEQPGWRSSKPALRAGNDPCGDVVRLAAAFDQTGETAQVLDAAVGATADEHVVDRFAQHPLPGSETHVLQRLGIGVGGNRSVDGHPHSGIGSVGDHRGDVRSVEAVLPVENRVRIAVKFPPAGHGLVVGGSLRSAFATPEVFEGLLVGGDHAAARAALDAHVADGHALGDGEIVDAGAGEKKAAVHEIVGAELAAEIQDEILAENVGGALAGEIYLHNLGHLKIERAGRHGRGQLRGADADADLTVTAAGAGVGVSNTNDIAGVLLMLFIHQLVDNAFTALIQGNAEFLGEVVHRPNIGAGLLRGGGVYMVNDQRHAAGIEDLLHADLAEHADGDGSRHVVRGDKAHLAGEILAGGDMFLASRFCQILFNKVHLQCPPGLFSRR